MERRVYLRKKVCLILFTLILIAYPISVIATENDDKDAIENSNNPEHTLSDESTDIEQSANGKLLRDEDEIKSMDEDELNNTELQLDEENSEIEKTKQDSLTDIENNSSENSLLEFQNMDEQKEDTQNK